MWSYIVGFVAGGITIGSGVGYLVHWWHRDTIELFLAGLYMKGYLSTEEIDMEEILKEGYKAKNRTSQLPEAMR